MATRKTTAERIADAKERIEQYENQMKLLLQKQKEQERRERTRRLIERGAILESLIPGADSFTNEQIKLFLEKTVQTEYARRILKELAPPPAAAETAQEGATAAESGGNISPPSAAPKPAETERGAATGTVQTVGNGTGKAG
jgi:TolA-binding protein